MTKEELYRKFEHSTGWLNTRELLDKFFSQNVVIPKGENRHPFADVLHEWIEGAEIQVKLNGNWSDYRCSRSYIDTFEYRIKPPEPVYETMWYDTDGKTKWFTDDEANEQICYTFKARETKRLRQ